MKTILEIDTSTKKDKKQNQDNPFDHLFENEDSPLKIFTNSIQYKKKEKEHSKMKLQLAKIKKELRIQEGELMTPSYLTKKATLVPEEDEEAESSISSNEESDSDDSFDR
jgi:hypothetical protein